MASWIHKMRPDGVFDLVPRDELSAWMARYYPAKRLSKSALKFKSPERGSWIWRDGKVIRRTAEIIPFGGKKGQGLQIVKDIEPFRNVAIDRNQIIGGRKQKRDMMRAYNVTECGDMPANPGPSKPRYDAKKHQASVVDSLKRALHQHGMGD